MLPLEPRVRKYRPVARRIDEGDGDEEPEATSRAVRAPAWGLECGSFAAGNLVCGTDTGLVVVSDAGGRSRGRTIDACALAGLRPQSAKATAVAVAATRLFVALQTPADRDSRGYCGRLLSFDLASTAGPAPAIRF